MPQYDDISAVRAPLSMWSIVSAAFGVTLTMVACSAHSQQNAATDELVEVTNETPRRSLNPAPRRAYEIRVAFENAPGPFASIGGVAQYDVINEAQCGDYNGTAGVHPRITINEEFTLSKLSGKEYAGVVYFDLVLDEEYYGRGVCQWEFTEARVVLKASADEADSRFVSNLPADAVQAQGSHTKHFWKGYYPRARMDAFPDFGEATLDAIPADKRGEFFRVTLTAKEIAS